MSDLSAIPGGSVFESFQKLTEKPVIKNKATRQGRIASLDNSTAFKALQEVIDLYIQELENIPIDPKKDDVTSVGFRYLASRVTIDYLKDLRDMPKRYAEILKEPKGSE